MNALACAVAIGTLVVFVGGVFIYHFRSKNRKTDRQADAAPRPREEPDVFGLAPGQRIDYGDDSFVVREAMMLEDGLPRKWRYLLQGKDDIRRWLFVTPYVAGPPGIRLWQEIPYSGVVPTLRYYPNELTFEGRTYLFYLRGSHRVITDRGDTMQRYVQYDDMNGDLLMFEEFNGETIICRSSKKIRIDELTIHASTETE